MRYKFHLIFEKGDKYFIGYCPEVSGANGQGTTKDECRTDLLEAIDLVLGMRAVEGQKLKLNRCLSDEAGGVSSLPAPKWLHA